MRFVYQVLIPESKRPHAIIRTSVNGESFLVPLTEKAQKEFRLRALKALVLKN